MQKQIDSMNLEIAHTSSKLSDIEAGKFTPEMSQSLDKIVESKGRSIQDEVRKDCLEMHKRRTKVIVYNMEESDSSNGDARKEFDTVSLLDLLHNKLQLPRTAKPKTFFRLGRKDSRPSGAGAESRRPRPIKVIFSHEGEKQDFLSRFAEVKKAGNDSLGDVRIGPDQTKWEQMEYKRLKEELSMKLQNGETDLVIRDLQIKKRFRNWPGSNA